MRLLLPVILLAMVAAPMAFGHVKRASAHHRHGAAHGQRIARSDEPVPSRKRWYVPGGNRPPAFVQIPRAAVGGAGSTAVEPPAAPAMQTTTDTPSLHSNEADINWHLRQADQFWNGNQSDQAVAQWREVLRLDPGNAQAATGLGKVMSAGTKEALRRLGAARSVSEIAEALDSQTDDGIAQQLLVACRKAVQDVDGHAQRSSDPAIYDDLESYIDSNGLGPVVASMDEGIVAPPSSNRLYGRKFLLDLAPWIDRARLRSSIYVRVVLPFGVRDILGRIDGYDFAVAADGVDIDGTNVGPGVPLRGIYEDGLWRIAPRPGYRLTCGFATEHVRGDGAIAANLRPAE